MDKKTPNNDAHAIAPPLVKYHQCIKREIQNSIDECHIIQAANYTDNQQKGLFVQLN